jgi:hypothetical protein
VLPTTESAPKSCWADSDRRNNAFAMPQVGLKCYQVDLEAFSSTMEVRTHAHYSACLLVGLHMPCRLARALGRVDAARA